MTGEEEGCEWWREEMGRELEEEVGGVHARV